MYICIEPGAPGEWKVIGANGGSGEGGGQGPQGPARPRSCLKVNRRWNKDLKEPGKWNKDLKEKR